MEDRKVAVVTGGTSGIGLATVKLFAAKGWTVYTVSRHQAEVQSATHLICDITCEAQVEKLFRDIYEREGRIDVLVNNAGFGISGPIEFTKMEDARRLFEANFFGGLCCTQKALPLMRQQGSGSIVTISSVAAVMFIPYQSFYSATKAAVNALYGALANEVRPFGINVCCIMPGDVKTGFTAAREKSVEGQDVYGAAMENAVKTMEHDEQTGMSPEVLAQAVYRASTKKRVKLLYTPGLQYKACIVLGKILPTNIVNKIVGKIYS